MCHTCVDVVFYEEWDPGVDGGGGDDGAGSSEGAPCASSSAAGEGDGGGESVESLSVKEPGSEESEDGTMSPCATEDSSGSGVSESAAGALPRNCILASIPQGSSARRDASGGDDGWLCSMEEDDTGMASASCPSSVRGLSLDGSVSSPLSSSVFD